MTLDDLLEVFNKGLSAKLDTEDYPREVFGAPTLNRAGIAAVVLALRDEILDNIAQHGEPVSYNDIHCLFFEILGDAGDEVAGRVGDTKHPDVTSPAADPAPAHSWFEYKPNLITCRACGIVRRADGKNKPCKGVVRVGPRATAPAPAVCVWRANEYEGAYSPGCETSAVWYSDGSETPQNEGYNFCPSCGKPIKFTEAKT